MGGKSHFWTCSGVDTALGSLLDWCAAIPAPAAKTPAPAPAPAVTPASECWFCICRSAKGGGGGRSIRLDDALDERSRVWDSTSGLWRTSEVASGSEGPASVISISVSRAACSGVRSWMIFSPATSSDCAAVGVGAITLTTGLAVGLLGES
jgi:hypothetical protein